MPTTKLRCVSCARQLIAFIPRRNGAASALMVQAYEQGWRKSDERWFCCDGCVAAAAKDVTPTIPQIVEQ